MFHWGEQFSGLRVRELCQCLERLQQKCALLPDVPVARKWHVHERDEVEAVLVKFVRRGQLGGVAEKQRNGEIPHKDVEHGMAIGQRCERPERLGVEQLAQAGLERVQRVDGDDNPRERRGVFHQRVERRLGGQNVEARRNFAILVLVRIKLEHKAHFLGSAAPRFSGHEQCKKLREQPEHTGNRSSHFFLRFRQVKQPDLVRDLDMGKIKNATILWVRGVNSTGARVGTSCVAPGTVAGAAQPFSAANLLELLSAMAFAYMAILSPRITA
ncbi:hypothetical protein KL938_000744 [Ogataea parapolymorpha]|nr:hypothetical protein KL938_000744 [Ogataea parapolymorpha]